MRSLKGSLAVVAILCLGGMSAQAAVVTYHGQEYETALIFGTSDEVLHTLVQQPWWCDGIVWDCPGREDNGALAIQAWELYGPVIPEGYNNPIGALVAYNLYGAFIYVTGCSAYEPVETTGCLPLGYAIPVTTESHPGFAQPYLVVADTISVDEPGSIGLLCLGLLSFAFSRAWSARDLA